MFATAHHVEHEPSRLGRLLDGIVYAETQRAQVSMTLRRPRRSGGLWEERFVSKSRFTFQSCQGEAFHVCAWEICELGALGAGRCIGGSVGVWVGFGLASP